ncbi:hypothetical protein BWP11_03295 [Aeromonas hydrophila]|uniref:Uncharacterized protein n=3 Tax=Aeromonadaceae TaxID=84642 RepID=A0KMK8_AERHH|nr:hypothetical protein AHA_3005 [Aeromonas hydrophila subsp. hydrophila ATCC 7966]OOD35752.1 hypothetical protein BWP11_03295 [Aeromonas hydrophila]
MDRRCRSRPGSRPVWLQIPCAACSRESGRYAAPFPSLNESDVVMRAWVLCLSLGLLSAGAQASVFKSECNLDKAVKNEALNATLGVKGNCDTDKLVRQQKEKAKAEVKKNTTDVLDQKTAGLKEGKSQLQGTQQKVNQAGQQLKQTQQDVKAVAKDPLKAAATAVINQG